MRSSPTAIFVALLAAAAPASAQWSPVDHAEPEPVPMTPGDSPSPGPVATAEGFKEAPHERAQRWYGGQTLVILAANDAVLIAGLAITASDHSGGAPVLVGASVGHVLAGPIVHFAHGHVGTGFAAFGMSLGIAAVTSLAGLGIGAAADHDCTNFCIGAPVGAVAGAAAGGFIAPFIDAGILAREPRDPGEQFESSLTVLPFANAHGGGLRLGAAF